MKGIYGGTLHAARLDFVPQADVFARKVKYGQRGIERNRIVLVEVGVGKQAEFAFEDVG